MKFEWNGDDQKYIKLGLTAFVTVVLCILANQVLHQVPLLSEIVRSFFSCLKPIIYGLIFAYLLTPALNMFERLLFRFKRVFRPGDPKSCRIVRGISIVLSWGLMLAIVSVLIKMVVPEIVSSVEGIIGNMPVYVNRLTRWVNHLQILQNNPEVSARLVEQIRSLYKDFNSVVNNFSGVLDKVPEFISNVGDFVGSLSSGVFNAVSGVFNMVIGIIVSIYVMGAKEKFVSQAKKTLYGLAPTGRANATVKLIRSVHQKFGGFFVGKIIDSLIIGVLCSVLLSMFRIPYPVLVGCIIGITNIIPFFGPFIGAIPSAVLILLVNPMKCLYFIIIVIVLQQFDGNILGPKILSNSIGISSFWVMFSILLFGGMFGFWGLICGVPVFAVIYELISDFINSRLKNKNLSTVTADYRDLGYVDAETGEIINKEKEKKNDSEN